MTQYDKRSHMKRPISRCRDAFSSIHLRGAPEACSPSPDTSARDAGAGSVYSDRGCSHNRLGHTDISVRQPQLLRTVACRCSASLDATPATQRLSTPEQGSQNWRKSGWTSACRPSSRSHRLARGSHAVPRRHQFHSQTTRFLKELTVLFLILPDEQNASRDAASSGHCNSAPQACVRRGGPGPFRKVTLCTRSRCRL